MSNEERVHKLVKVLTEFVDFSDWSYRENGGNYSGDRAKKNIYIIGKFRYGDKSPIVIDGKHIGWTYNQDFGGKSMWKIGYIGYGLTNIVYDRTTDSDKKLRVERWSLNKNGRRDNRTIFSEIKVGSNAPNNEQITETVQKFWAAIDILDKEDIFLSDNKVVNLNTGLLLQNYNLILRGAPGTGKTYLANEIAANIVSNGRTTKRDELNDEEEKRVSFVQFHPSYDYTDFVEGLRPFSDEDGTVGFTLKDGSFKSFVEKATEPQIENNFADAWHNFMEAVSESYATGGYKEVVTRRGNRIPNLVPYKNNNGVHTKDSVYYINRDQLYRIYQGLPSFKSQGSDSYREAIIQHLKDKFGLKDYVAPKETDKKDKYVFIIDEINRGEISKIFGELFYSIDPGYRGNKNGVLTQYANLHDEPTQKFYIPDNVYIIGTMNDIDRSVDTFDFAMRRRFTFIEISAKESSENMLHDKKVIKVMSRLNDAIIAPDKGGLGEDYQIGASYFLELDNNGISDERINSLWNNKLKPLLKDYFRGEINASDKLLKIEKEYYNEVGNENDNSEGQF